MEKREISVEVTVYNAGRRSYERFTFAADKFGEAIDIYNDAVDRFERADDNGYCGATGFSCSACQPGPCGSRLDEKPVGKA